MKTCLLRFARPRLSSEGLFCLQTPEAGYELTACGNCALCYPQYDMRYRTNKSIVQFSQTHRHTFVNGYQSILNCSAVSSRRMVYSSLSGVLCIVVDMSHTQCDLCLDMSMW